MTSNPKKIISLIFLPSSSSQMFYEKGNISSDNKDTWYQNGCLTTNKKDKVRSLHICLWGLMHISFPTPILISANGNTIQRRVLVFNFFFLGGGGAPLAPLHLRRWPNAYMEGRSSERPWMLHAQSIQRNVVHAFKFTEHLFVQISCLYLTEGTEKVTNFWRVNAWCSGGSATSGVGGVHPSLD